MFRSRTLAIVALAAVATLAAPVAFASSSSTVPGGAEYSVRAYDVDRSVPLAIVSVCSCDLVFEYAPGALVDRSRVAWRHPNTFNKPVLRKFDIARRITGPPRAFPG